MMLGRLISSCCPRKRHEKQAMKKKRERIKLRRPLENEYPVMSDSNQVVSGTFNQLVNARKNFQLWIKLNQNKGIDLTLKQSYVFQNVCVSEISLLHRLTHVSIETATNFSITLILYCVSITVVQQGGTKGIQPSHLDSLTPNCKRFNMFWTWLWVRGSLNELHSLIFQLVF